MKTGSQESRKPGKPEQTTGTRARILDAAEIRLLAMGPAGLVLEAVASDAGISKGGLLYHFPSKDALVTGLTERMLDVFDAALDQLIAAEGGTPGAGTRAYLATTVRLDGEPADSSAQLMAAILAAIGRDSPQLEMVRERFEEWHQRLQSDGLDPTTAALVRLAADGLWLSALLGLPRLDPDLHVQVYMALLDLTQLGKSSAGNA
ncbi:MAG: TetR/AcrR family transcriptional regulator [bacterium]|nr:TetR/AcrR family transcriptional regulator [bacterium]